MSLIILRRPYRFFLLAAGLAMLMCLLPLRAQDPAVQEQTMQAAGQEQTPGVQGVPAGADLSERTAEECRLHLTLCYALCGHSVQRREALPTRLKGLTRDALEKEIGSVVAGACVTGFSAQEVDASVSMKIPCPLHWVLRIGEDGMLGVYQNRTGDALSLVRTTDVPASRISETERAVYLNGRVFDDVQAMEGVLENMSS